MSRQQSAVRGACPPTAALGRPARRATRLLALAALVACNDSIFDMTDPEVRIETPLVWAGVEIALTSPAFFGSDTLPLVLVGGDTVAARYAAPDSVIFAAPDSQGAYTIWVALPGRAPIPVGEVSVKGGYSGWHAVPEIGGFPLQWPGGGVPTFLIAQASGSSPTGLARVDPRFWLRSTLLPNSIFSQSCINGPGPAPGGRIAVQGSGCGPLVAVRPDAPGLAPDTGPSGGTGGRFAAQLGPTRWLVAYHHGVLSWSRDAGGTWHTQDYGNDLEEPYGIAVSPRADRAVVLCRADGARGIPVFTPESPEPAYWLTQFTALWGAQFSDDSDTLYVVGVPTDTAAYPTPVLAALAASDGAVLRAAPGWPFTANLVLDPGRPWLYLVGHTTGWTRVAVHVVDRATFTFVTTLVVPAGAVPSDTDDPYPMLSAAERKLYLVMTCAFCTAGSFTRVVAFDLMP